MRLRRVGLLIWLAVSTVALQGQGQSDRPLFRGGVELIQLDVSVLDADRHPVRGLKASDFTVWENGKAVPIRAFTPVELPAIRASAVSTWPGTVVSDVATNHVGEEDGRLVIILMDRSIHIGQGNVIAKQIATAIVEALGPQDLGAVVSTSGRTPQSLTADRSRLIKTINQPDWSTDTETSPWTVRAASADDGRCLCGLCVLNTLTRISEGVRQAPRRRKLLFFIGSGVILQPRPTAYGADIGCDSHARDARQALLNSLALSNLTVHSIDPKGLSCPWCPKADGGGGTGVGDPNRERMLGYQSKVNELLDAQGTLQVLPERTGGRAILNTNFPELKVPELFHESDAYYVIGFEPGTKGRLDVPRSIDVKVKRNDVRVVAQRQYEGTPLARALSSGSLGAPAPVSLDDALSGLLPAAGRSLSLAVAASASLDSAKAVVALSVDVGRFAGIPGRPVSLEVAAAAVDQAGTQVAFARQTSVVTVPAAKASGPAVADVQSQLELPPGDYEVRVAVSDPVKETVASVFAQLVVPPFDSAPLSLSDVTMNAVGPAATGPAAASSQMSATTRRAFHHDDRVDAYLQIYQGTHRTESLSPVSMQVRLLDRQGRAVRDQTLAFVPQQFTNRRAGCHVAIDVAHLAPGEYLLSFEGSLPGQRVTRAVRIAVQ